MMIFAEKLRMIRKKKGLTQEGLAEILGVSRQAVAKWESGQSYPDIDNLIAISVLFKVTVDYLVKDNDECMVSIADQQPYDLQEIAGFLVRAKVCTYAGKGCECEPSRPNAHDYQYQESTLLYIDTYVGGERFSGQEAVWKNHEPVYAMNYCGRVLADNFNGDFLKAVLREVPEGKPFRGPVYYQEGDYIYQCKIEENMDWFQGYEEIFDKIGKVYECCFHGGSIR